MATGQTKRAGIRIIGLTGGIASGKSSVARLLLEHGAVVIDADELSRDAVRPGSVCLQRIAAEFGADLLQADGSLDRKRLGTMIFADSGMRKRLESIIHPEIRRLAEERIQSELAAGRHCLFYMAPLLIEAGADSLVDEIWVVSVSPVVQLERLMARDGISREEAERIIASQMPLAEKERRGSLVIRNDGSPGQLQEQIEEILKRETGAYLE